LFEPQRHEDTKSSLDRFFVPVCSGISFTCFLGVRHGESRQIGRIFVTLWFRFCLRSRFTCQRAARRCPRAVWAMLRLATVSREAFHGGYEPRNSRRTRKGKRRYNNLTQRREDAERYRFATACSAVVSLLRLSARVHPPVDRLDSRDALSQGCL